MGIFLTCVDSWSFGRRDKAFFAHLELVHASELIVLDQVLDNVRLHNVFKIDTSWDLFDWLLGWELLLDDGLDLGLVLFLA